MPKFAQDVPCHLDGGLVAADVGARLEAHDGCVLLDGLVVGHCDDHAVPDVVRHGLARQGNELQDDVHVPVVCGGELFRKQGDFDDQLFTNVVVGNVQVVQQLAHNVLHVLLVGHAVQQVQRAAADADVRVLERRNDRVHVLADEAVGLGGERGQGRHGLKAQVADVDFRAGRRVDEGAQDGGRLLHKVLVEVQVHNQLNGFKQHRQDGVLLVDIAGAGGVSRPQDGLQDLHKLFAGGGVRGRGVQPQEEQQLDLQPGVCDVVIHVVCNACLPGHHDL
mmetsp:Transcript_52313/g.131389  ORF Transcript_52313/g.131389 Transcript_52313/m.131389 type:complete len:278 (+) Transcript_52313:1305-2138(+)